MAWGGPPRWPRTRRTALDELRAGEWSCTLETKVADSIETATGTGRTKESAETDARRKLTKQARRAQQVAEQRDRENKRRQN